MKAVDVDRWQARHAYTARFSLTRRGSWKLVAAYSATTKYAAKISSAKYVRVR